MALSPFQLDELALVEPGDDLLDGLGGVLVLDDLAGGLRRRRLGGDPLGGGVVAADLRGVDLDVAGADACRAASSWRP